MKVFFFSLLAFTWIGCASHYYVYDVRMTHPIESRELFYENDTFSIEFHLEPKDMHVYLSNKTDEGIRINWDDVSMSLFGNANRIVHKETSYAGLTFVQPSTTIPPHSKLSDYLIPTRKVRFYEVRPSSFVVIEDVFPDYDNGEKYKKATIDGLRGSEVNVFLPFYLGESRISKYYLLKIEDIKTYKKKPKGFELGKVPTKIGSTPVKKSKNQ